MRGARRGGSSRPGRWRLIYGLRDQPRGAKARLENWLFNLFTSAIQPPLGALILAPAPPTLSPAAPDPGRPVRPARPWCGSALRSRPRGPGTTYHSPAPRRGEAQAPAPGVAAFGPAAVRPPTPRSAERGWRSPGCLRRSRSRAPGCLPPTPGPRLRPPFLRLGLDALAAGWRRVTTSLPWPRSSRFLRSGKSARLGGVGRRPPPLIFAARGAATATVGGSVRACLAVTVSPHSGASPRTWTLGKGPDPERGGRHWPPPKDPATWLDHVVPAGGHEQHYPLGSTAPHPPEARA